MPGPITRLSLLTHIHSSADLDITLVKNDGSKRVLIANGSTLYGGFVVEVPPASPVNLGDRILIQHAVTGGLIGWTSIDDFGDRPSHYGFVFEQADMYDPNEIGPPPEPAGIVLLPRNSACIVVGLGSFTPAGHFLQDWGKMKVVHEQYWRRGKNSYSLVHGQSKTVVVDQTSGVTLTTETETDLNAAAGFALSGSYGPFSASLSASLSYASTHRSRETLSIQTTTMTETTVTNKTGLERVVLSWELVDRFHLYSAQKQIMLESTQSPPLLRTYSLTA